MPSVGRPATRWADDLMKIAGTCEKYGTGRCGDSWGDLQQWTSIGWYDDDARGSYLIPENHMQYLKHTLGIITDKTWVNLRTNANITWQNTYLEHTPELEGPLIDDPVVVAGPGVGVPGLLFHRLRCGGVFLVVVVVFVIVVLEPSPTAHCLVLWLRSVSSL